MNRLSLLKAAFLCVLAVLPLLALAFAARPAPPAPAPRPRLVHPVWYGPPAPLTSPEPKLEDR
jgi:hypothetical protein